MKILEIIPELASGGAERFVVDLCNELAKEHDVCLMIFNANRDFFSDQLSDKINIVVLDKCNGFDFSLPYKMYKTIRSTRPDVIHTHLRAILYLSVILYFLPPNIKCFHTIHSDADKEAGGFIGGTIRKFFFHHKRIIPVTISNESAKTFRKYYGFNAPIIYNGRNIPLNIPITSAVNKEISDCKLSKDDKVLVCLARFNDNKRQDMLARIALRLDSEGYKFTLLMIGRKDAIIYPKVQKINCRRVHVLGERINPLEFLKASDASCLCSLYEGLPISLIESMGMGSVPICTPVGGIVDVIIDGQNGLLSENVSEREYYNVLKKFLTMDQNEIKNIKTNAELSCLPYMMTHCAANYVSLFTLTEYRNS